MHRLFASLLSILLVGSAVLVGGYWQQAYSSKPAPNAQAVAFAVQSGENIKSIAQTLQTDGIISNSWEFELFNRLTDAAQKIQAGNFQLKPGMSFQDVMTALSNATAGDVQVTIPEGYTVAQTFETVHTTILSVTQTDWTATVGPGSALITAQNASATLQPILAKRGLEGFLFPDTYRFNPTDTAATVAAKMYATFNDKISGAGIKEDASGQVEWNLNLYEFVTLASIVQKEVQTPADMKIVADIFLRRLQMGMPLQADSTINYVTGGTSPSVSTDDTKLDSAYNTYKYPGLPPGPISNPGLDALTAVLQPTKNDYLYFLTTPDGTVEYATTYDQQIANKQKYLK